MRTHRNASSTPTRLRRRTAAAAALLAGTLGLTACAFPFGALLGQRGSSESPAPESAPGSEDDPVLDAVFSPQAPAGAWLLPAYADGIDRSWKASATSCGVTDDSSTIVLQRYNADDVAEVYAVDLASERELWAKAPAQCEERSVADADVFLALMHEGADGARTFSIARVAAASGEVRSETPLPDDVRSAMLIGADAERAYARVYIGSEESRLLAIEDGGGAAWERVETAEESQRTCQLLDAAIGCSSMLDSYLVLDAETGRERVPATAFDAEAIWAHDGFMVDRVGDEEYLGYDLDGRETGALKQEPEISSGDLEAGEPPVFDLSIPAPPSAPSSEDRAFYALEDFAAGGRVRAVDADGRPVVVEKADLSATVFAATGNEVDGAQIGSMWDAVASDGSVILFRTDAYASEAVLLTPDGERVGAIASSLDDENFTGVFTGVQGGLLVTVSGEGIEVHLPSGYPS